MLKYHQILQFFCIGSFQVLLVLTVFLAGCDDRTINPFEEERAAYSIYGALELDRQMNYVRIRDLTVPFLSESTNMEEVTVLFEDLQGESATVLRDTIVNFSGNQTHNYIVNQMLEPRKTYHITVNGPDGKTSSSNATTPGITEIVVSPTENISCNQPIDFQFKNVKKPEYIRLEVGFHYDNMLLWSRVGTVAHLDYSSQNTDEMHVRLSPLNLLVEVFPPGGRQELTPPRFWLPTVLCHQLDSGIVQFRFIHFGPEWDILPRRHAGWNLVELMDSGQINNGHGFFGAIHRGTFSISILTDS